MENYGRMATRFPTFPQRADVAEEELEDYEYLVAAWIQPHRDFPAEWVDGRPWGVPHYEALAVAAPFGAALMRLSAATTSREGLPGTVSHADHEIIDQVLAFDSGYKGLLAGHTPIAVARGVRIEALEALGGGREGELTEDERQQIEFIRAVRDGKMTDEIWSRMRDRLGTERGVVDYVALILVVWCHHHFAWTCGLPEISDVALRKMVRDFKEGRRRVTAKAD